MRHNTLLLFFLFGILCGLMQISTAQASITWSGDLDPADPTTWDSDTNGYVGKTSDGTLNITDGGIVHNRHCYLGYDSGSTGIVIIDGPDSMWENNGCIKIGCHGDALLNITGGGTVTVEDNTYVGEYEESMGAINFGTGGGTLTTQSLLAPVNQLRGTGTINTRGLVSDLDLVFDSTHALTQTLTLNSHANQDITVNLDMSGGSSNNGCLGTGYRGSGTLMIKDGIEVSNEYSYLGYHAGSTGTTSIEGSGSKWSNCYFYVGYYGNGVMSITDGGTAQTSGYCYLGHFSDSTGVINIDGSGSTWTVNQEFYVGEYGNGTVNITNGSEVSCYSTSIGRYSGSMGVVNIDGSSTTWNNSDEFHVGRSGNGTLNISGGASVTVDDEVYVGSSVGTTGSIHFGAGGGTLNAESFLASPNQLTGTGIIHARGLVSDVDLVFDSTHGLSKTISFNSGLDQNITLHFDISGNNGSIGHLGAGHMGNGSLQILDGVTVNGDKGYLGFCSGSTGVANINGNNSTWINRRQLYVGYFGNGTMHTTNGGSVSNTSGYLGYLRDSTGAAHIDGTGSTWTNTSDLYVGYYGNGTLNISNGGYVVNDTGYLGYEDCSTGTVNVDGPSSTWANDNSLYIGYFGNGALSITNGGSVTVEDNTYVGHYENSTGTINFGTSGGTLTTKSLLASTSQLSGTGTIYARGLVSDVDLTFDPTHGRTKTISVSSGPDQDITIHLDMSNSSSNGCLGTGYYGNGLLTIQEGAWIRSESGYLGCHAGSVGIANVDGTDSTWANDNFLYVGRYGNGTLNISNGGTVVSDYGVIGAGNGSMGIVNIDGASSFWRVNGPLDIGSQGNGMMNITNSGVIKCNDTCLGYYADSTSLVNINGSGSILKSCTLYIGKNGKGTLNITNSGLVQVRDALLIDYNGDNDSFVNMASGGMLALYGDVDDSLADFLDWIDGTDAIRYWDNSAAQWDDLTGATPGMDYTLVYIDDTGSGLYGYTLLTVLTPGPIPGDLNGDKFVNEADASILASNWGKNGGWAQGDFNNDGVVNAIDASILAANWGDHTEGVSVPEPSILVMLLGMAGLVLLRRRI